ncbi:MAG: hypothetical protein HUJ25_12240 [Crocinitomicaceae bacterium]|nr:hypothetical protein [Crocinitomicaceae bacterium]
MKIKLLSLTLIILISGHVFSQWRIDFGVEAQINQNKVKKWELGSLYTPEGRTLSMLDVGGDTLDIFFNKFTMDNNFEIPIYFRLNRNRHFVDFKLSNSFNTLKMDGIANYNHSYYEENYGSYSDFEAQALADGFTNVDSSDYNAYIAAARKDWETDISYVESFQLLSLTINYGYRFLPHKSIKPFVSGGFTVKGKYRKANYDYLRFSNEYIQDLSKINDALNNFAEASFYGNFVVGLELYRFRLSAYFQSGIAFAFPVKTYDESTIVYASEYTAFDQLYSFGFNLGADLFRQDFGKKVFKDNVTKDEFEVSKIERKKDKWDFGVRFSRRGFNELSTFYGGDSLATNYLAVAKTDSVLVNVNGTLQEGQQFEVASFGDIKRIGWSGQMDAYASAYFGKRWLAQMSFGFSALDFDVETKELTATVAQDSSGNSFYVQTAGSPRVRSGVYRKAFNLYHLNTALGYKVIDRDIFDLRLKFGTGITFMAHRFQGLREQPDGVNELGLYEDIEGGYYWRGDETDVMVYTDGPVQMDLNQSPDSVTTKFTPEKNLSNWSTPATQRQAYTTVKLGIEATIDRFSLGMSVEGAVKYMDGYMLSDFSSIYFSIGYKIWSR